MSFVCREFKCQTILFDPQIGPYQVPPIRARVDLRAMVMKGYSAVAVAIILMVIYIAEAMTLHSSKLQQYWNLTIGLFSVICRTLFFYDVSETICWLDLLPSIPKGTSMKWIYSLRESQNRKGGWNLVPKSVSL